MVVEDMIAINQGDNQIDVGNGKYSVRMVVV